MPTSSESAERRRDLGQGPLHALPRGLMADSELVRNFGERMLMAAEAEAEAQGEHVLLFRRQLGQGPTDAIVMSFGVRGRRLVTLRDSRSVGNAPLTAEFTPDGALYRDKSERRELAAAGRVEGDGRADQCELANLQHVLIAGALYKVPEVGPTAQ